MPAPQEPIHAHGGRRSENLQRTKPRVGTVMVRRTRYGEFAAAWDFEVVPRSCSVRDLAGSHALDWSDERARGFGVVSIRRARVVAIGEIGVRARLGTVSVESQHGQRTYLCVSSTCCGIMMCRSKFVATAGLGRTLVVAPAGRSR